MNGYTDFFLSSNSIKNDTQENNSKTSNNLSRFSSLDVSYCYKLDIEVKKLYINDMFAVQNFEMANPSLIQESTSKSIPKNLHFSRSSDDSLVFSNFSQQSILFAINRFVKSVISMQSIVLIPSKLKDMKVHATKKKVKLKDLKDIKQFKSINHQAMCTLNKPLIFNNSDLYTIYHMLNEITKELMWGNSNISSVTDFMSSSSENQISSFNCNQSFCKNKHVRPPSVASLGSLELTPSTLSTLSISISDQERDDSETDSLLADRDSIGEHNSCLAGSFRYHSQGLHTILNQLTDAANYISARYQQELDNTS